VALVFDLPDKQTTGRTTNDASAFSVQLTYAELNRRADQLAHYLCGLGVGPETRVGIYMDRSLELAIAVLGILKAGAAYVPLDPTHPRERLQYILEDSRIAVLITIPIYDLRLTIDDLEQSQTPIVNRKSKIVNIDGDWPAIAAWPSAPLSSPLPAASPAYVIYTSGSTGRPKGVQIPHGAVVNFLCAMQQQLALTERDRLFAVTTLSFDIAGLELFLPLAVGACVVIAGYEQLVDGGRLAAALADTAATVMQATPALWQLLIESGWQGSARLKLLCGGEALPQALADRLLARGAGLWNLYGPTETTIWSTAARITRPGAAATIGRPIGNTQIYLLDSALHPVPIGVPGELYIGGAGLARGYLDRPDLTAERFIPNPFAGDTETRRHGDTETGDVAATQDSSFILHPSSFILYRTGDRARYLANGAIEYLGRLDQQVKLRGFRIELGEIAAALARHPSVQEAVVSASEDIPGDKRLVAYVVPHQGSGSEDKETRRQGDKENPNVSLSALRPQTLDPRTLIPELRAFLKARLPDYMIPSAFTLLDTLPRTPNGKVDRRALPAPDVQATAVTYIAPRTPVEELLAKLWANVLGRERVGIHDNFFTMGGHSLLAAQVLARVRDAFHVELPLRALFEAPTVAELATWVERDRSNLAGPLAPSRRSSAWIGIEPLSYSQARMWLLDQLDHDKAIFNISIAIHLTGSLDMQALQRALAAIMRRHETLRTTFAMQDGRLVQTIGVPAPAPLPLVELSSLPGVERVATAQQLAAAEAQRPFDVRHEQLLRLTLLRLGAQEHQLIMTMHHLASDGWSFRVLFQELAVLYDAFSRHLPAPLPELPIQYADFAIWQRQVLREAVLDDRLAYWKRRLSNLPPSFGPKPTLQSAPAARHPFALSRELSEALRALSQRHGVFLFVTLLTALKLTLARAIGHSDIVVGVSSANRDHIETRGLIGFFANMLVLRTDLSDNPTFEQALQRVREVYLESYEHRDLPIELLLAAVQHDHIEVVFNFTPIANNALAGAKLGDLAAQPVDVETKQIHQHANLVLVMFEGAEGLYGSLKYKAALFDAATIQQFAESYLETLASLIASDAPSCSRDSAA